MNNYPVSEIFESPQGEGQWTGTLCTFVRLAGCTVGKPFGKDEPYGSWLPGQRAAFYQEKCTAWNGESFACFLSYEQIPVFTETKFLRKTALLFVEKGNHVQSWTSRGVVEGIVTKVSRRWVKEDELVTVCLRKPDEMGFGTAVVVTKDHRFMTVEGEWIRADKLTVCDVLQHTSFKGKLARCPSLNERKSFSRRLGIKAGRVTPHRLSHRERKAISKRMREHNPMKDPAVVAKGIRSRAKSPSGAELKIRRLAEQLELDLKFTGNGKLFVRVGGKTRNPDFLLRGTKKIVEVYDSSFHYTGERRNGYWARSLRTWYKKAGYDCCPIDVHTLSSDQIKKRLFIFAGNGLEVCRVQRGFFGSPGKWGPRGGKNSGFVASPGDVIRKTDTGREFLVTELAVETKHNYIGPLGTINHNCDTNYRFKERMTAEQIGDQILDQSHVVLTGGEPLMHNLMPLLEVLRKKRCQVHVETSGTLPLYQLLPFGSLVWITVSPKKDYLQESLKLANEIKILVGPGFDETVFDDHFHDYREKVWLQPINGLNDIDKINMAKCVEIQKRYPMVRLSIQLHKILGVR